MHNLPALLVVARQPQPGQTKTRLCPPLNDVQAAGLYECFLLDTLQTMRQVPGVQRVIAYTPAGAQGYFQAIAPDFALLEQRGADLAERLDNLLADALAGGAGKAVVLDSDSPTLPAAYLAQAFERLEAADVVLGPAVDGGYYLIGLKKPQPHLLRGVSLSTPSVLQDTLRLAALNGLDVALLPEWYDVDTVEALNRLYAELTARPDGTGQATRRWLAENLADDRPPRGAA